MKNLFNSQTKNLQMSKLFSIVLFSSILFYSCSNNEKTTKIKEVSTNEGEVSTNEGVLNSVFVSMRTESYDPTYFYFWSQDSLFYRRTGTNIGFNLSYTINETGIIVNFSDANEKFKLLGNSVLKGEIRDFYKVSNFYEAVNINK